MKTISDDDEIAALRLKTKLTKEEFDRLDELLANKIEAITNALMAEPDDDFGAIQNAFKKFEKVLR